MESTYLALYCLSLFSLYFTMDAVKPVILVILAVSYACILFSIGTNLLVKRLPATIDRFAIVMWTSVWAVVLLTMGLRDLGSVIDISIIGGVLLFVVLVSVTSSSCYIIIHNSKHWFGQLFAVSALNWVLFHDSQSWLIHDKAALAIPTFTMVLCRVTYYSEMNRAIRVSEFLCWAALALNEILFLTDTTGPNIYYYTSSIMFSATLGTMIGRRFLFFSMVIPLTFPLFVLRCMSNMVKHGWYLGVDAIFSDLMYAVKFISREDLTGLLKPSIVDDL